jgi:hypothetical protein
MDEFQTKVKKLQIPLGNIIHNSESKLIVLQ